VNSNSGEAPQGRQASWVFLFIYISVCIYVFSLAYETLELNTLLYLKETCVLSINFPA